MAARQWLRRLWERMLYEQETEPRRRVRPQPSRGVGVYRRDCWPVVHTVLLTLILAALVAVVVLLAMAPPYVLVRR